MEAEHLGEQVYSFPLKFPSSQVEDQVCCYLVWGELGLIQQLTATAQHYTVVVP